MNLVFSLDELLDTRLGTLVKKDIKYIRQILENEWTKRESDSKINDYTGVDLSEYKRLYGLRNTDTLKVSKPTKFFDYFRNYIIPDMLHNPELENMELHPTVFLNIYPYQLSKDEKELFKTVIRYNLPTVQDIKIISLNIKSLTPTWFKSNKITHFICYDAMTWLNLHLKTIQDYPISALKVICPEIEQINSEPYTKEIEELAAGADRYDMISVVFSLLVGLVFIPVEFFSIDTTNIRGA